MGGIGEAKGLSTEEAFERLVTALQDRLEIHKTIVGRNWKEILRSSLSTRSRHSTITWSSLALLFVESIIIITLYATSFSPMWTKLLPEGMIMLFLVLFNTFIVIWENCKRVNELPAKLQKIVNQLREIMASEILWEEKNYPDLFMPVSPCISLQWCYRDGKLVNLPWALLVHGDVIVLQAAQKMLADCELIGEPAGLLKAGEIYSPQPSSAENSCQTPPRLHTPLPQREALVTLAPYLDMVDMCLDNYLVRPPSFYNKERHTVVARIVECILLPLAIMTFVALCLVRMFYLPHWLGIRIAPWADIILLQPMASTFGLIPVALPTIWTLLECIGNARLWKGLQIWAIDKDKDILESPGKGEKVVLNQWRQKTRNFISNWNRIKGFFFGREETLHRSQKILHILASTTALCCVDKKGVLSWPNPTPEKLFFFRTVPTPHGEETLKVNENGCHHRRRSSVTLPSVPLTSIAEVLDITVDNNNELHFDDIQWENFMPNLKPLGLNILLNTCNQETEKTYSSFHTHISHELLFNKDNNVKSSQGVVIPATSRRCLCEVSDMIGFKLSSISAFALKQELCSYRHIESDQLSREELTKAKIKFPFPHMMSTVVKEKTSQTLQLFSQGTGDLLLDVCEDFWDGKDLRPLTDIERKLISDFYQRTSLSSISTSFAYRPVQATVDPSIAKLYMELPPSRGLRMYTHNILGHLRALDTNSSGFFNVQDTKESYISTDCLLGDVNKNAASGEIKDVRGSLQMQVGQIFLGMITMTTIPVNDWFSPVQLIEQLDQGCIRFVHFSKENELRSRVFSEKMGLESGWNCHISLKAPVEETSSHITESASPTQNDDTFNPDLVPGCKNNRLGVLKRSSCPKPGKILSQEEKILLPRCSASVPEMKLLSKSGDCDYDTDIDDDSKTEASSTNDPPTVKAASINESLAFGFSSDEEDPSVVARVTFNENKLKIQKIETPLPSSNLGSISSAVLSPDSYREMFEFAERPTPLGIDLANTAQLPVGIENIRPHLDSVDNVPLLVSLFTDCNADNTREMVSIMQDYGEVTLLLGSASNYDNAQLFLQADASVAIEPLYPQSCVKRPTFVEPKNGNASPTDIAMLLTSLPCALSLKRKDCSVFYDLIAQARHFMNKCVRNSIQFWICCNCAVTFLGVLSLLMLLPPLFSLSDSIWLACVIIPILTLGLAFAIMSRVDISVMNAPSFKNQMVIDKHIWIYAFWCYGMKFIPSTVNLVLMASFNLRWICEHLPNSTCSWVYPISANISIPAILSEHTRPMQCISTWSCVNLSRLTYVQQFSVFFLVFYFILISSCFLYRSKYLWVRNPAANKIWVSTSVFVLILQLLYWIIKVESSKIPAYDLLPTYSYIWGFIWAPVALAINELIRRHEIKVNIRYEKRARLDFGTKLGMNSPF